MKRNIYCYAYRLFGEDRFEAIYYGTRGQISCYSLRFGSDINLCPCSKTVAVSLSHDIGIPIENVSFLQDLK